MFVYPSVTSVKGRGGRPSFGIKVSPNWTGILLLQKKPQPPALSHPSKLGQPSQAAHLVTILRVFLVV
jgi:hypothetical protein